MNRGIGTLETIVICLTFSSFEFQKERKEIGTEKKKNIEEIITEIIPNLRDRNLQI